MMKTYKVNFLLRLKTLTANFCYQMLKVISAGNLDSYINFHFFESCHFKEFLFDFLNNLNKRTL